MQKLAPADAVVRQKEKTSRRLPSRPGAGGIVGGLMVVAAGAWSHVVSLLYAQITHSLGRNDVCDALRLHSGPLSALRGATLPPKNTLSYANRTRDPKMAYVLLRFCDWLGPVEPQLHPPLRPHPLGPLAKTRFAQPLGKLWDSRG